MSLSRNLARRVLNYNSQDSMGAKLRAKRIAPLREMIEAVFSENNEVNIIDVGGTHIYWGILPADYLARHNVTITVVNVPGAPQPEDHGPFRFVAGDGCNLAEFGDGSFHIAHSNSVLEHVGDWERMVAFAKETSRVASRYFVQTPNFWFPIEPHCMTPFFHWLPKPTRLWLVSHFELGCWNKAATVDEAARTVDSARLVNRKMFKALFDGEIVTERLFFMPKSFIAIRK